MSGIVCIAEADSQIGFGHLREMLALREGARRLGIDADVVVVGPRAAVSADVVAVSDVADLFAAIRKTNAQFSFWSLRRPLAEAEKLTFSSLPFRKIWVSDLPDWPPPVDVVVSPSLVSQFRASGGKNYQLLAGPEYFPLDPAYETEPIPAVRRPCDVLVTLGGADRSQATLRLMPAFRGWTCSVVVGPGFLHAAEVAAAASAEGFRILDRPDGIREHLLQHRVVISAGGNTLYEAAATGTPAVIAWEDGHEERLAYAFAEIGAAIVAGQGRTVPIEAVRGCVGRIFGPPTLSEQMAHSGRVCVDGRGVRRILEATIGRIGPSGCSESDCCTP